VKAQSPKICLATSIFAFFVAHNAYANPLEAKQIAIYGVLADDPSFDTRTKNFKAKGNIALLTSEGFLTGELMSSQDAGQLITIEGNVSLVRKSEKIHASRIIMDRRTGEFNMFDAEIVTDPLMSAKEAVDANLLGITIEEVAFERARQERVRDIEKELYALRESYVRARNLESLGRESESTLPGSYTLRKKYSETLRRLVLAKNEPNQVFDELSPETQKRLRDRRNASRDFLNAHPEFLASNQSISSVQGYARVRADKVYRAPDGVFSYSNASLTPCRCSPDTTPIFGISTASGNLEVGGYAHMRGTVLDVFNVPVLYTPYFIYPVKRDREMGFLKPYFFMSRENRVVGVPFFLPLGEHADTTLSLNNFADRGTRLDLEARFQLSPESRLELYGEYISDNDFKQRSFESQRGFESKISEIRNSGTPRPLELEDLEDRLVKPTNKRWYARGGWSVPITGWAAAKTSGEMVSDPGYFSDFSTDDDNSTPGLDLLKPAATSKRFLTHEASVEYYGNESVISGRIQGVRDIFSLRSTDTIYRVPRFEFAWLPRTYFGLPFSVDGMASWERVRRNSRRDFVDLVGSGQTAAFTSLTRDGLRQPEEPYVSGDRTYGRANFLLPLPVNNYVNASLGASLVGNEYRFPTVPGETEHNATQHYFKYSAEAQLPLFSDFNIFSQRERSLMATLRHDFVPTLSFTSVPDVWRSQKYPFENQLFYAQDAVYPMRQIGFGFRSTWTLAREDFSENAEAIQRIPAALDPGVGTESEFTKSIAAKGALVGNKSIDIHTFSTLRESTPVFELWADSELTNYYAAVRQTEFGNNYVWNDAETFRRVQKWRAVPFSFGLFTGYNLDAKRTEREKQERNNVQNDVALAKVPPWGDINVSATASSDPFLPLSLNYSGVWSVLWDRWTKHATSLRAHWKNTYTASTSLSNIITPSDKSTTKEQAWGYSLGYNPRSWISFGHAWSKLQKTVDGSLVRDKAYNDADFDTSNSQFISLTGLQDCMDITFKRQKDFKQRERGALWSIGINMNLFGQKTGPIEVGQPLNSMLQKPN
jgi:LPS-assembly protein